MMAIYKNGVNISKKDTVSFDDFVTKVEKMVKESNHTIERDRDLNLVIENCYKELNYQKAVEAYVKNSNYYS